MCMNILPACMYVLYMGVWCLQRPEENFGAPGIRVTDICELPTMWVLGTEPDPLEE